MPRLPLFRSQPAACLLACCLFAFVLGANWATSERFGSDLPDWDQYDAEATDLLTPWFEHDHFVSRLLQPHSEHRVILTKLQNLAVVLATGQWDARVETFFNALLHATIAVALWVAGRRWLRVGWQWLFFLTLAALYGLPLAWQNLLGGFHSQQYWLILLSFAAVALLPFHPAGSLRWWAGLAAAVLALGSMGSGFLAAAVVVGLVLWRCALGQCRLREAAITLAAMAALIAAGLATHVEVPYHERLKAASAHDFGLSLLRSLAWPVRDHDWIGVVLWAPWVLLTLAVCRQLVVRRRSSVPTSRAELIVIGLGGWVLVQLLATAYARGAGGEYPASRYMDTLMFGAALNALALGWLLGGGFQITASSAPNADAAPDEDRPTSGRPGRPARIGRYALTVAWVASLVAGFTVLWDRNVRHELPDTRNYYRRCEAHVRAYLATNDPATLAHPIPYPSAEAFVERVSHPGIRTRMPSSVRPALPIKRAADIAEGAFLPHNPAQTRATAGNDTPGVTPATGALAGWPTWGSFASSGAAATGVWRSEPIAPPRTAWLRLETAGNLGEPGVSLQFKDAATGTVLADIQPSKVPGESWRTAYVRTPRVRFVIEAADRDPARWFAFSAPVEMTGLSHACWWLMKQGLLIAEIAAGLAFALGVVAFAGRSRAPAVPQA